MTLGVEGLATSLGLCSPNSTHSHSFPLLGGLLFLEFQFPNENFLLQFSLFECLLLVNNFLLLQLHLRVVHGIRQFGKGGELTPCVPHGSGIANIVPEPLVCSRNLLCKLLSYSIEAFCNNVIIMIHGQCIFMNFSKHEFNHMSHICRLMSME